MNKTNERETKQLFDAAITCYQRHKRHRFYASDSRAKRQLAAILAACRDVRGSGDVLPVFHDALEKQDERGSNFLKPPPREPKPIPEPWRNAHGKALGNPLLDPDEERGKRGMRVLKRHDPALASYFEKAAKDPYGLEQSCREEARDIAEWNKLEIEVTPEVISKSVLADPNASQTDKDAYKKAHAKFATIIERELKPPRSNVFGREKSETVRTLINKSDPELWGIIARAEKHNAELLELERREAVRARAEAQRKIDQLTMIRHATQVEPHAFDSTPEERARNPKPFPR